MRSRGPGADPQLAEVALPAGWAQQIVGWQAKHGRNDLPWQGSRDPYRVWLSEIMLQQTQVVTVIDYYTRFLHRFPDVLSLSTGSLDEVLGLWSGLGYYSRARNLHACAVQVVRDHGGVFPQSAQSLQGLPGIGPSTAAAIASICHGERAAILDGNVKRVLARVLGFDADLGRSSNERTLWQHATALLPTRDLDRTMPRYTQGVMDLGATICLPRQPRCEVCPVAWMCQARSEGQPLRYPVKTSRLKRTSQSLWLLWATTGDGAVWLRQRPSPGVWAGLHCFELFDGYAELEAALPVPQRAGLDALPVVKHVLTHRDLYLHPVRIQLPASCRLSPDGQWHARGAWQGLGLPAPVRRLLEETG